MQLTDAEIREILIRRKIEKKRRLKRRRRRTIIAVLIIIVLIILLVRFIGHGGKGGSSDKDASAAGESRGVIFIDPGHGGEDPGSDDDKDRYEKDDTLRLSLAVRDYLREAGYKVEMSRTEDKTVDRAKRGEMANKAGAELFISVHRNKAATDGKGVEGFIPKANDKESRMLGENIIHALGRVGFEERTIRAGTLNDPDDDYEENASSSMPSVLIEVGFLSSSEDNALFDNNLNRNAKAIANAIDITYMSLYDPERAAEYNKQLTFAEEASDKAMEALNQGISETGIIIDKLINDGTTGIDPEA